MEFGATQWHSQYPFPESLITAKRSIPLAEVPSWQYIKEIVFDEKVCSQLAELNLTWNVDGNQFF